MAFEYIYKSPSGEETPLKLTIGRIFELEQRFGKGLDEMFEKANQLGVSIEFVAAAIIDGNYEERKEKAIKLYQDVVDNGQTIADYQNIIIEILKNAGFMTPQRAELLRQIVKAEEEILNQKAENIHSPN